VLDFFVRHLDFEVNLHLLSPIAFQANVSPVGADLSCCLLYIISSYRTLAKSPLKLPTLAHVIYDKSQEAQENELIEFWNHSLSAMGLGPMEFAILAVASFATSILAAIVGMARIGQIAHDIGDARHPATRLGMLKSS
jgi:hypothetical protein